MRGCANEVGIAGAWLYLRAEYHASVATSSFQLGNQIILILADTD